MATEPEWVRLLQPVKQKNKNLCWLGGGGEARFLRLPQLLIYLTNVNFLGKFSGSGTVSGEDSSAVAVHVRIDCGDGIIQCVYLEDNQNRAEDFLAVALHRRLSIMCFVIIFGKYNSLIDKSLQ